MATFTDLLRTDADADVFEALATTVPLRVDPDSGAVTELGPPGLYYHLSESPDGEHLLVYRLQRPFSFRVPFPYFARRVEVWSAAGELERVIADLPVSDEVPRQGVPTGPRMVSWEESVPASLVWAEALDGGDPLAKAEHRDQLLPAGGAVRATRRSRACRSSIDAWAGTTWQPPGTAARDRARPGPPVADLAAGRPGLAGREPGHLRPLGRRGLPGPRLADDDDRTGWHPNGAAGRQPHLPARRGREPGGRPAVPGPARPG